MCEIAFASRKNYDFLMIINICIMVAICNFNGRSQTSFLNWKLFYQLNLSIFHVSFNPVYLDIYVFN